MRERSSDMQEVTVQCTLTCRFADGIESGRLEFLDGQIVHVTTAEHTLNLVMPAQPAAEVERQ